ncbi:hypothetical protein [Parasphingorhabdus sp.]|uniref:hypothetical protein n=1 Tax=Parasphingorhabdus sp. TaxID=2709688 RepID=UPI003A8DE547
MSTPRKVLIIGGLGDGRVITTLYGDHISLTRELYEIEKNSDIRPIRQAIPATEYKIHSIEVNENSHFYVGLPDDVTPTDAMESLLQCYANARKK